MKAKRRNLPAGQAKTRNKVRPPRKPYVERDDGENASRLAVAISGILGLSPPIALAIRRTRKKGE
jgi:hypothetical protein